MKLLKLIFIFYLVSCSSGKMEKAYFEVYKIDMKDSSSALIKYLRSDKELGDEYFKILPIDDYSDYNKFNYPPKTSSENDTLSMIESLLTFKGDTRPCILPIMTYRPEASKIYMGQDKSYSIQLEALFLINQLYFDKPFIYSPIPVLVDKRTGESASVSGDVIDKAYESYHKWVKEIKSLGITNAKKKNINPLDGSDVRWY